MISDPEVQMAKPSNRTHRFFTKTVHSLSAHRRAPPRIPLPHSIIIKVTPPTPPSSPTPSRRSSMHWDKIELSNYPPQLTYQDVLTLFQDFTISPDFVLPNVKNLAYPLRTFIRIAGEQEAERAVQELCWSKVGGRQINVRMVEETGHQEMEVAVADVADEMKIGIVNTARVYNPHLTTKILEVRECMQGTANFAFLQARDPVTVSSKPEAHMLSTDDKAKWELVMAGRSEGWNWKMKDGSGRLAALKDLQDTLQRQGIMRKLWGQWEGSSALDMH
ncbi:hypothetical protein AA0116_g1226 [Alternaria tenuissima]|nr:hypothetical protein AA0116_g1226 [Alternaria tenuissima]